MNVGEKVRDEVMGAWEGLEVEWLCNKIWSILGRVTAKWDTHQISHQHSIEDIVELDTVNLPCRWWTDGCTLYQKMKPKMLTSKFRKRRGKATSYSHGVVLHNEK